MGTDENFVEFSHTLQSWSDHFQDFISAFRALHFVKTRLYILQFSDSKQLHRSQILTSYIDTELELLLHHPETFENVPSSTFRWTGTLVELVELIYGMQEMRCIDDGEVPINKLFAFFDELFGMEINTLGYTFRFKNPKNPIRTLRLYASGLNLYTFTRYQGVDPEINFNGLTPGVDYVAGYPTTRTFTFGVKLGF